MFRKINFSVTAVDDSLAINLQRQIQTQREWENFIKALKEEAAKSNISFDSITCTVNGTNQGKHFKNKQVTGLGDLDRALMMEQDRKPGFSSKVASLLMPTF